MLPALSASPGIVGTEVIKRFNRVFKKKTVAGAAGATTIATIAKVPKGKTLLARVVIFAKDPTSGDLAHYEFRASVSNKAGTVALIGTVTAVHTAENDNTWVATAVANDTKDSLDLQVTPDGTNDTVFWGFAEVIVA